MPGWPPPAPGIGPPFGVPERDFVHFCPATPGGAICFVVRHFWRNSEGVEQFDTPRLRRLESVAVPASEVLFPQPSARYPPTSGGRARPALRGGGCQRAKRPTSSVSGERRIGRNSANPEQAAAPSRAAWSRNDKAGRPGFGSGGKWSKSGGTPDGWGNSNSLRSNGFPRFLKRGTQSIPNWRVYWPGIRVQIGRLVLDNGTVNRRMLERGACIKIPHGDGQNGRVAPDFLTQNLTHTHFFLEIYIVNQSCSDLVGRLRI